MATTVVEIPNSFNKSNKYASCISVVGKKPDAGEDPYATDSKQKPYNRDRLSNPAVSSLNQLYMESERRLISTVSPQELHFTRSADDDFWEMDDATKQALLNQLKEELNGIKGMDEKTKEAILKKMEKVLNELGGRSDLDEATLFNQLEEVLNGVQGMDEKTKKALFDKLKNTLVDRVIDKMLKAGEKSNQANFEKIMEMIAKIIREMENYRVDSKINPEALKARSEGIIQLGKADEKKLEKLLSELGNKLEKLLKEAPQDMDQVLRELEALTQNLNLKEIEALAQDFENAAGDVREGKTDVERFVSAIILAMLLKVDGEEFQRKYLEREQKLQNTMISNMRNKSADTERKVMDAFAAEERRKNMSWIEKLVTLIVSFVLDVANIIAGIAMAVGSAVTMNAAGAALGTRMAIGGFASLGSDIIFTILDFVVDKFVQDPALKAKLQTAFNAIRIVVDIVIALVGGIGTKLKQLAVNALKKAIAVATKTAVKESVAVAKITAKEATATAKYIKSTVSVAGAGGNLAEAGLAIATGAMTVETAKKKREAEEAQAEQELMMTLLKAVIASIQAALKQVSSLLANAGNDFASFISATQNIMRQTAV